MRTSIAAAVLLFSVSAFAEDAYVLKPDRALSAVLGDLTGKTVVLHLRNGEKLTGKLSVAGGKTVQLSELSGREFYDAVIPVESIDAVEVRARSQ